MRELRERTIAQLEPYRERAGNVERLADIGVSDQQAAADVTGTSLDGARPLTPAFLATMVRHDRGAIALLRAELRHGRDAALQTLARGLMTEYLAELERLNRAIAAQQTA
jgi:uncharacterized protein (DUF305 family)